jgi:hypothetical protein
MDHGVPRSWYPDASEHVARRVTAPSCTECNGQLKLVEERTLIPMALGLDRKDPRAAGIAERVLRSIDPTTAKSESDRRARAARRRRVQAMIGHSPSGEGVLPGFEPAAGSSGAYLPQSARDLELFGEKLSRVVFYSEYRRYIREPYGVHTHIVQENEATAAVEATIRNGKKIDVPPGIRLAIRVAEDDPNTGLIVIDIWGRARLFTSVVPEHG